MKIAVTGATGFLGRYIVRHLAQQQHHCRCWNRSTSDRGGFEGYEKHIQWVEGELNNVKDTRTLVAGCDAVVHAALYYTGDRLRSDEDVIEFAERNVIGTLRLIEAARAAGAGRFVFISSCAVHEKILDDRPLDETHPLWPADHYGAHKAALEMFVHSYGLGKNYPICALRPSGIYGLARPPRESRWWELVQAVVHGRPVASRGGGKVVHAADVAKATGILLAAEGIAGQSYNCTDRYVSDYEVATIAKRLTGSESKIDGGPTQPKHQIVTENIRALGMTFGGLELLETTVSELTEATKLGE